MENDTNNFTKLRMVPQKLHEKKFTIYYFRFFGFLEKLMHFETQYD